MVKMAPGTSISVNSFGWRELLAACTVGESEKQASTSRIVVNVMLIFFIFNFPFVVLTFFDFSPCRLRPRTRVATACQGEISFQPFTDVLRANWQAVTKKVASPR